MRYFLQLVTATERLAGLSQEQVFDLINASSIQADIPWQFYLPGGVIFDEIIPLYIGNVR